MKKILGLSLLFSIFSFSNITVDGNTNVYVEKSNNGIDIINISTPSPKGISHSTFKEFNVSEKGAVINNAKNIARSHIAGLINGNNNIKETRAKLALLDVTGIEESKLKGILEALSKDKLDVILSNPNGITLDGASFLNIHNMSLTTSKVNIDENNKVSYLKPTGDIKSLKELNTKENLEIVANKFTSDSDIYAKKLNVTTYAGEEGTLLSADIIGSIYGDVVKIVATKSGIGVKSITSKDLSLESKTQANIETIKTNNLDIKVEEDFINKDKIISNNSISIEANNILNDKNILISDNISLKAKENISNLNGAIIHADKDLILESLNLNNIGKVNSYGSPIKKWITLDNKELTEEEVKLKWIKKVVEQYDSYNALKQSSTDEAKNNALSAFYDEVVVIDPTEFDWRILKNHETLVKNRDRAGKPGIFFSLDEYTNILKKENISKVKEEHKRFMYENVDKTEDYTRSGETNIILKGFIENKNANTNFSILSGENINISTKNVVNNKDGHIIANNDNNIKANTYNNSSSISDEKITIQDGYEKMIFDGSFNCPGGLVYCNILHNATYIRDLGNNREVNLKGLPSYIKGENILIDAENVNFKSYSENESKKTLREEDEKYVNNKEELEINGKKIEYNIEDNPKYVKLSNFLSNPYFLNNIKYNSNNKYLIENFKMNQNNLESKPSKSNITINAKNLNIKDQKLLFDNINLLSNNILIEGAKLKALDNLNIKSDNIFVKSIVDERSNEITYLEDTMYWKSLVNEKQKLQKNISSNILAKNIKIDSNNAVILGSNILVEEDLIINSDNLELIANKTENTKEEINENVFIKNKTKIENKLKYNEVNSSNILGKNVKIGKGNVVVNGSNVLTDEKLYIDANKVEILEEKANISREDYLNDSRVNFDLKVGLRGANIKLGYSLNQDKSNEDTKLSHKSNISSKEVKINLIKDIISSADISAEKLEINADNILLKDVKDSVTKNVKSKNFNIGLSANVGSSLLDIVADTKEMVADKKIDNALNIASNIHKVNKIISGAINPNKLVDVSIGLSVGGSNRRLTFNSRESISGKIDVKDIKLNAKEKVTLINQEINGKNLEINSKETHLLQGESTKTISDKTDGGGVDLSFNPITVNGTVGARYNNKRYSLDEKKYSNTKLNVGNIKINSEKVEKEDKKDEKHEDKSSLELGFSISAGMIGVTGLDGNIKANNTGIGLGIDLSGKEVLGGKGSISYKGNGFALGISKEGKITSSEIEVSGEKYNAHLELVHKENRDKVIDDFRNVLGTPGAYVRAMKKIYDSDGLLNIGKEIKNEIYRLNVNTETGLNKYEEIIFKTTNHNEKWRYIKLYLNEIASLRGEFFKDINLVNNLLSKNGELAYAGISGNNGNLVLNSNEINIENLEELKKLAIIETNRWTYEDEEKDNLSVGLNRDEILSEMTTLDVPIKELSEDEMGIYRNFIERVPPTKKELEKVEKELENIMIINNIKDLKHKKNIITEMAKLKKESKTKGYNLSKTKIEYELINLLKNPNYKVNLIKIFLDINQIGELIQEVSYQKEEEIKKYIETVNENGKNIKLKLHSYIDNYDKVVLSFIETNQYIDGKKQYIVLAKGTTPNSIVDWSENISSYLLLNLKNHQTITSHLISKFIDENGGPGKVEVTCMGHSKGGGQCIYTANNVKGVQSIVVDPAGVNTFIFNKDVGINDIYGINPKNGLLNFFKDGFLKFKLPFTSSIGGIENSINKEIELKKMGKKSSFFNRHNTGVIDHYINEIFFIKE